MGCGCGKKRKKVTQASTTVKPTEKTPVVQNTTIDTRNTKEVQAISSKTGRVTNRKVIQDPYANLKR